MVVKLKCKMIKGLSGLKKQSFVSNELTIYHYIYKCKALVSLNEYINIRCKQLKSKQISLGWEYALMP